MINDAREPNPRRNARLQDVAVRAGVSVMTVSLALREDGAKRMSGETRERVLKAVKELRYQPNARARAFRLGRTNVLGLYAGHGYINVRSPFFTEVVSGLQEGCEQVRKDLLLHSLFHGKSPEDILSELTDGRIDGLVVSMPKEDPLAGLLAPLGLPVVALSDRLEGVPSVVVDDRGGMRQIVKHLFDRGHRRIEFVLSPALPDSARQRCDEVLVVGSDLGMDVSVVRLGSDEEVHGLVASASERGVSAYVCWNDVVARRMLAAAVEQGISVPGSLAITGFDGCPSPFMDPFPLTTIHAPWSETARLAIHQLDAILIGEEVAKETILPVSFVQGATT